MTTISMMQNMIIVLCFIAFLVFNSVKAQNAMRALSGTETTRHRLYHRVHESYVNVFQRSSHFGNIGNKKKKNHKNKGTKVKGRKGSKDIGKRSGENSIKMGDKGNGEDKGGKARKREKGKKTSGKSKKSYATSAPSFPSTPPTDTIPPTRDPTEFVTPTPQPTTTPTPFPTPAPSSEPSAETIVLYRNDFETPNQEVVAYSPTCAVDFTYVNTLHGTEEHLFNQEYTVETFVVDWTWNSSVPYSDPQGIAGSYALAMSTIQDDLLGLSLETSGKAFVNVAMDISSIDIVKCGTYSVGIADPIFRVSLLDDPNREAPLKGAALDFADMTGPVGPNQWTFLWTRNSVALDASKSTKGRVSVVFELIQSGYAALDNLVIQASDQTGTAQ